MTDPLIDSLRRAVDGAPDDVALRLHLAELLLSAGNVDDAIAQCATALSKDPASVAARGLMARAMIPGQPAPDEPDAPVAEPGGFNWSAAEHEVSDIAAPMFVTADDEQAEPATSAWEVENAGISLADV